MRIQPRQQLLEIWSAVVRSSWQDGRWHWGGRDGSNSISDAEQLLCILLPATRVETFKIDNPDKVPAAMVQALRPLGNASQIPRTLIQILNSYFTTYTDESDRPVFSGGTYFETDQELGEPSPEQRQLDIVDSFAMSVTLSLATIGFVKVFRTTVSRSEIKQEIDELSERASLRLSAAMIGLLRSFSVFPFDIDSESGQALCRTINQTGMPTREVIAQFHRSLQQTTSSFREVLIGSGQVAELDSPNQLYECGWSWGVVADAPAVPNTELLGEQPLGVAEDKPYLYFTVIAMDAIEDLFSERTRNLGLLNEEQQRLARALQLRSELTRAYWAEVATFGDGGRWPLEDIPWRTTDRLANDYFTLLVTSLAVKGLVRDRGSDTDLSRVGTVLTELANRARITRRASQDDPSLLLHSPGVRLALVGSEKAGGPRLSWRSSEFSALLMLRTAVIAGLISDFRHRAELLELADRCWEHLLRRRIDSGVGRMLWDQPGKVFDQITVHYEEASWYHTERVVHGLVTIAEMLRQPPLRSDRLMAYARDLLGEAEHLYDMELFSGAAEGGPKMKQTMRTMDSDLRRAREVLQSLPGVSAGLALEVLRQLDSLAVARRGVSEAD